MSTAELIANDIARSLIPVEVLEEIGEIAGVSESSRTQVRLSIRSVCEIAAMSWRRRNSDPFSAPVRQSLRPIQRLAKELHRQIAGLDHEARRLLHICAEDAEDGYRLVPTDHGRHRNITIDDYAAAVDDLAAAAKRVIELGDKKRPPGAPKGSRYPELELLIGQLRRAIEHEGGGSLTYNRHAEGGTLVTVLKLLRPHLPLGLIPRRLPWRALEAMTSRKTSE
jgi:hypothetical protein